MIPEGIVTTGWPQVEAKGLELGLGFDWWQCSLGRVTLGKRIDGKYAATVGGVVLSIPRQVGKTYFVGALVVIMCILFPGLQVVWTAHRTRTATRTFRSLQGMVKRKRIRPYLAPGRNDGIRTANGEQEILFRNGSMIMFGAREQGFGRGFDEIDIEVFDEAQILTEKALEDMVAATNQSRHPHGALLFYMGTPPRPVDPGEVFTLKRRKALDNKTKDQVYLECSADPESDPDDPAQWAKANFSYPSRTPHESMLRLRENLGTDEGWWREGLGVWDDDTAAKVLPGWGRCGVNVEQPPVPAALGVASDLDQVWLALGAASQGRVSLVKGVPSSAAHLGSVLRLRDVDRARFVAEVARIQKTHGGIPVAIDAKGPASFLIPDLEAAGVRIVRVGLDDYVQACADLRAGVETRAVEHGNYDDLNAAVNAAGWRTVGDRRVFARKSGDISSLEAVALALFACSHQPPAPFVLIGT